VDLVAGGWSFHALDVTGRIHHWGTLDGSLGNYRAGTPLANKYTRVDTPRLLAVELPPIKSIAAGRAHAVALDAEARDVFEIWSWGRVARLKFPSSVFSKGSSVRQISAGWQFSALLSAGGEDAWIWWKASDREEDRGAAQAGEGRPGVQAVVWEREVNPLRLPDLPPPKDGEQPGEIMRIDCGDNFVVRSTPTLAVTIYEF
jgi:SCF-associated factor 1